MIGLQGIVVKSHGSASVRAFAVAIEEALMEIESNVIDKIKTKFRRYWMMSRFNLIENCSIFNLNFRTLSVLSLLLF